jgi:hypothetical protein
LAALILTRPGGVLVPLDLAKKRRFTWVITQGVQVLSSLNGSVALTSGVAPGTICQRLALTVTSTGSTISITTLDGNTVSLGTVSAGFYQLDLQFSSFTAGTPANVNAVGLYRI